MTILNEQDKPETRATVAGRLHVFVMLIFDWHKSIIMAIGFWLVCSLIAWDIVIAFNLLEK